MKILQVTPRYPPHTGGVETHVKVISEWLVEQSTRRPNILQTLEVIRPGWKFETALKPIGIRDF